jgi:hypothetical protein
MPKAQVVVKLIKERREKLLNDNQYLHRQVEVKAQRLEDIKAVMATNSAEIKELDAVLWNLDTDLEDTADNFVPTAKYPPPTGGVPHS